MSTPAVTSPAPTVESAPVSSGTPAALGSKDPATSVGGVVLTWADSSVLCADGRTVDAPTAQRVDLLLHGRVLLTCADGSLVMVDVYAGAVVWRRADGSSTDQRALTDILGPRHLVRVREQKVAASGLQGARVEASVEAIDLESGTTRWTSPLERDVVSDWTHGSNQEAWEDPSPGGTGEHGTVVVHRDGYSAYDARTGGLLWHVGRVGGQYIGFGVAVYDTGIHTWTARTAKTGAVAWTKDVPTYVNAGSPTVMIGPVGWWINSRGAYAIDVRTGRQVTNSAFPQSWKRVVATPTLTLAFDGRNLGLYRTGDTRTPLWSVPGDEVDPIAISSGLVVVRAQAGLQALSSKDGSLRPNISVPNGVRDGAVVVDGLIHAGTDGIYELGPPSA